MSHLLDGKGAKHLLLGNEAIARGALEAGVGMISCYPGTPSSEVPDTFNKIRNSGLFQLEYSINEKVALEVGIGASLAGAMALITMKHVGLNVASDPLLTATYIGTPGGLVVLSADDPACHSSQNEQDNRYYARLASMPCFEPSSAQEAKDMAKAAFLLSRELRTPVLLRTTTRLNHLRGIVEFGDLPAKTELVAFKRDPKQYVSVAASARDLHRKLAEKMEEAKKIAESSTFNNIMGNGNLGIIASGISRAYLHDIILRNGLENDVKVLNYGMTWPVPEKLLSSFLKSVPSVLVLEEGEPLAEKDIRALAQQEGITTKIYGKHDSLTIFAEYSTYAVEDAVLNLLGRNSRSECGSNCLELPQRPPNLCAGCSHRSVYYAVRKIFGDDAYYSSDIGCYTLGVLPPLRTSDFFVCMGASISTGCGFSKISGKTVVAFIGDSTFFHSGMTSLVNAVSNKHNLLLVILDNGTTAMTGHQPNPGVDQTVLGDRQAHVDIEKVVQGLGVTQLVKVKGYNQKSLQSNLLEMKEMSGVRVLLVEEPCVLFARRVLKKERSQIAYVANQDESVQECLETFACQAFRKDKDGISVDPDLCVGCMVCMQISSSFKARKRDV